MNNELKNKTIILIDLNGGIREDSSKSMDRGGFLSMYRDYPYRLPDGGYEYRTYELRMADEEYAIYKEVPYGHRDRPGYSHGILTEPKETLTIVYAGYDDLSYSSWIAFNLPPHEVPKEALYGDRDDRAKWWNEWEEGGYENLPIGLGSTPRAAYDSLMCALKRNNE
jgi:hypothetical protein